MLNRRRFDRRIDFIGGGTPVWSARFEEPDSVALLPWKPAITQRITSSSSERW